MFCIDANYSDGGREDPEREQVNGRELKKERQKKKSHGRERRERGSQGTYEVKPCAFWLPASRRKNCGSHN